MRITIVSILAALSLSSAAMPATADTVTVTATSQVHFEDLDLANPADIAKLEKRVEQAVRTLCSRRPSSAINVREAREQCRESARRSANEELARVLGGDHPALASLSEGKSDD
jgi:UrcA family protein